MKILYSVQATGNGHISRAMTLLPYLKKYGQIDFFLSGDNSHLQMDAPIKYRSKGLSLFYNSTGGLDYWQIAKKTDPLRIKKEINELPVEKYDLVINDFDFITSQACIAKRISTIHFGHQASFQSPLTPRPDKKNFAGELLLKHFVKANTHIGLHFESYDEGIFGAIIKDDILTAIPKNYGHITVYLPSYNEQELLEIFWAFPSIKFEIFSKESSTIRIEKNVHLLPVNKDRFNESLINCKGIICGAGFETPAEAIQLGKKIMAIPIRGQYEQLCNAAALKKLGVTCLDKIDTGFKIDFEKWLEEGVIVQKDYSDSITSSLDFMFNRPMIKEIEVSHMFELEIF
jgi:uncharacterized protein (TIGR00661 family)